MELVIRASPIISFVVLALTGPASAQTIELKSSSLAVLMAAERERFVAAHNVARKNVGVDPVTWSDELSNHARDSLGKQKDRLIATAREAWKEGLAALPEHTPGTKYGENVAGWFGPRGRSAELAVELWLQEKATFEKLNAIAPYRIGDEVGKSQTDAEGKDQPIVVGHYTAVIWRATKQIGAAKLSFQLADDQGNTRNFAAIICNYSPAGNRHGEKPY